MNIKEGVDKIVKKNLKIFTNFKYPKLTLFILMIILAYLLFKNPNTVEFVSHLGKFKYLGEFIGGLLFAFGFTTPFAVGFFLVLQPTNIWLAALIGGCGALISDLLIFKFIKINFEDEFIRLNKTKVIRKFTKLINNNLGHKIKIYLIYAFSGIVLASPLPDELGILMLAGITKIKMNILAIVSFISNTIGIFILLAI